MRLLYIQLNQRGRIYDIQLNHRSKYTLLGICGRAVFTPLYMGQGSFGGHCLHTLSTFALRPEEEFAIPLSLAQGSIPMKFKHSSLTQL